MKLNLFSKYVGGMLLALGCAALTVHAQQRGGGGGGGGFGGFGGFGGGGFGGGGGNNANRSTTSGQYNNNGSVGNAVITVDPQTHNIVVIADEQTSMQISNVLANLDMPKPQVLIKVVFLEVQRNDASEIGVQGTYTGGSWGNALQQITGYATNFVTTGSGSNAITSSILSPIYANNFNIAHNFNLPQSVPGATGSGGLYQVIGNDFTATIQAIAAAGKSQVLARPSILARDGQLAKIVIGQQIYLPSGVTYTSAGTTTIPIINGAYTEVGIILNVTPFIGANGLVEMIVQPQTSSVDNSSPGQLIAAGSTLLGTASTPVYAPNLNIRSADTVVVTPSGQTVVIGGLISASKGSSETKIPFLGDIPILGQLFRSTSKSESKNELLMFLTPHIVEAPTQLAAMTVPEMHQAPLITNSISEQELDRFLQRVPAKKIEPVKKKK